VAEAMAHKLTARYPGLRVAGWDSPPFSPVNDEQDRDAISKINASGADILWVGLGAPKQEYWMADHLGKVEIPVMVGVGAAFDFLSGAKRQAPKWMQRAGLEWLYRLVSEPGRLWKRYLYYNPLFVFWAILQLLNVKQFPIENNKTAIHSIREG